MSTNQEPCHIVRSADQQGTRPSVVCQAEVKKYATGCDGMSPSTTAPGYKNSLVTGPNREDTSTKERTRKKTIRIATINIRTLQDDIKLATVIKATSKSGIDVLAMQESRRTSSGIVTFKDESIKGWQLVFCKLTFAQHLVLALMEVLCARERRRITFQIINSQYLGNQTFQGRLFKNGSRSYGACAKMRALDPHFLMTRTVESGSF